MALPVHRDVTLKEAGADVYLVDVKLQRRRLLRAGQAAPVVRLSREVRRSGQRRQQRHVLGAHLLCDHL